MIRIVDDLGRAIVLPRPAARIVSLVPSDSYSIARLGGEAALVGRTEYCVEPASLAEVVPAIGGTKNVRVEEVIALRPDIVLANQEENSKRDVEAIERAGVRVLVAFPKRFAEGVAHLARLARLLGVDREERTKDLVRRGYAAVQEAKKRAAEPSGKVRVFVPIWMDPLMTINGETFISDMLAGCGADNVFADRVRRYPLAADIGRGKPLAAHEVEGRDTRYPRVTLAEVEERAPELVLLPDEPHPFTEADAAVFRQTNTPAGRSGAVIMCQGKDLCWPGAQSIEGYERLRALIDGAKGGVS